MTQRKPSAETQMHFNLLGNCVDMLQRHWDGDTTGGLRMLPAEEKGTKEKPASFNVGLYQLKYHMETETTQRA